LQELALKKEFYLIISIRDQDKRCYALYQGTVKVYQIFLNKTGVCVR